MDNREHLLRSAMFYGLMLGGFWLVKYAFFMIGIFYPLLYVVYLILTPLTLVFAYIFGRVYKILAGGEVGFFHAWQFGVLLYFFAALIVSLLHYVFYMYVAPESFLTDAFDATSKMIINLSPQARDAIDNMPAITPIRMTIHGILNNIIYGIIFSIPVAAITCRKKQKN
ncbi:MAG: DUF4199 domain-containing protein [Tannerellaceae bacterium]|jgi:hypothetical protein|nr:DUF4199 domain-containing protein [Tannerellaceae bacterium]